MVTDACSRSARGEHALEGHVDDPVHTDFALHGARHGVRGRQLTVLPHHLPLRAIDEPEHHQAEGKDGHNGDADEDGAIAVPEPVESPVPALDRVVDELQGEDEADRQQDTHHLEAAIDPLVGPALGCARRRLVR